MGQFPQDVINAAKAAEAAFYPKGPFVSIILAQWALESGYGEYQCRGQRHGHGEIELVGDPPRQRFVTRGFSMSHARSLAACACLALVAAGWGTFASAYVPVGEDALMVVAANASNSLYYADGAHPTNQGYSYIVPQIAAAVNALL
jgi:hypothetical protein